MKIFGDRLEIHQGEYFNMEFKISSSDIEYIPYIISSEISNPFFVISLSSSKFDKGRRYVNHWWNEIDDMIPRFYQTVPKFDKEYDDLRDLPTIPSPGSETYKTRLLYQYTLSYEDIDPITGHRPYHYYYFSYDNEEVTGRVDGYECVIRMYISTIESENLNGGEYVYGIYVVGGELLTDFLSDIYELKGRPSNWPDTIKDVLAYIRKNWPGLIQDDIEYDSPLGRIDYQEVILPMSKFVVSENTKRII